MRILLWGLGVPTAVLVTQIVWWRIRRPLNDVRTLSAWLVFSLGIFGNLSLIPASSRALSMPEGIFAALYALALAGSVSVLYLITYAGLDAKSPSTLIVVAAQESPNGLSRDQAEALFTNEEFIVERINGLVRIGQLRREGENIHLTLHGRLFLEAFLLPRRVMGLRHWGG